MPRVIHFEIGADDPARASKFYQDVFGWKINAWSGPDQYFLVTTGEPDEHGINGAITRRALPDFSTVNSIHVPSIDDALRKILAAGGNTLTQKTAVPGVGFLAYCSDTEGNVFGVFQNEPSAK